MSFDFAKLKKNFEDGKLDRCYSQLKKTFFPSYKGQMFVKETRKLHNGVTGEVFEPYNMSQVETSYFERMPKPLVKWLTKDYLQLFTVVADPFKPRIGKDFINVCRGFQHKTVLDEFDTDGVKMMISHIHTALCNKDRAQTDFVLNWLANVVQGVKNQSVLYLRGDEGIGKSTLSEFMGFHVIGMDITLITNEISCFTGDFNELLQGMVLVAFEDPVFRKNNDFDTFGTRLKNNTTSPIMTVSNKNVKSYVISNLNNYIVTSNHDVVKYANGRRIMILDLNNSLRGNKAYFTELHKVCFNNQVGHEFYSYLMKRDVSKFDSQEFPETEAKRDTIANLLDPMFVHIKERYLLNKKSISLPMKDLHASYVKYCKNNEHKPKTYILYNRALKNMFHIEPIHKEKGYDWEIPFEVMNAAAVREKWYHSTDVAATDDEQPDPLLDDEYGIQPHTPKVEIQQPIEAFAEPTPTVVDVEFEPVVVEEPVIQAPVVEQPTDETQFIGAEQKPTRPKKPSKLFKELPPFDIQKELEKFDQMIERADAIRNAVRLMKKL